MRFKDDVVELGDHFGHRVVNALGAVVALLRDGRDGLAEPVEVLEQSIIESNRTGAVVRGKVAAITSSADLDPCRTAGMD